MKETHTVTATKEYDTMTTEELIIAANANAQESADVYFALEEKHGMKMAIREWNKISANYSESAESNGVICESVICCTTGAQFYQNRFYIRKANGKRGSFSKAKAVAALG